MCNYSQGKCIEFTRIVRSSYINISGKSSKIAKVMFKYCKLDTYAEHRKRGQLIQRT